MIDGDKEEMIMHAKIALVFPLFILGLGVDSVLSHAETTPTLTTETARMDRIAEALGETHVVDKLSGEFSSFLGGDARAVVTGLRNTTPIVLTRTTPGTTINPPTEKMGFGNVFIALALGRQQLSEVGITQPDTGSTPGSTFGRNHYNKQQCSYQKHESARRAHIAKSKYGLGRDRRAAKY